MRSYSQFCPISKAAEIFCERWTPIILRDLSTGACRFSELQRGAPLMSPTLLSRRLKQLEAEGVVARQPAREGRGHIYVLTPKGAEFVPLVEALGIWGRRWSRRDLSKGEIDLGLALWALERGVDPSAFGARRTTVELTLPDQPKAKRNWWFVNQNAACELCVDNPGHEIDLYLSASLPDVIHLLRGDVALRRALDGGRLEAHGGRAIRARLGAWLNLSPLAKVAPANGAG